MVQHELQIHYGAPSLVSDDARWRTLASNIVNFEAQNTFKIAFRRDAGTTLATNATGARSTPTEHAPERHLGEVVAKEQLATQREVLNGSPQSSQAARKRKRGEFNESLRKIKRNKRTTFARAKKGLNPAFQNPVTTYLGTNKQGTRTPCLTDTNTLLQPTVLVPFTGNIKPQQTRLETTNNQQCSTTASLADSFTSSRVRATSFDIQDSSATEILDEEVTPMKTRDTYTSPTFQTQIMQEEVSFALSQTSLDDKTTVTEAISSQVEKDEVLDKLHNDSMITQSVSVSTESPTQAPEFQEESSPLARRSMPARTSVIDLTEESFPEEITRRDILGPVSSPVVHTTILASSSQVVPMTTVRSKLSSLPKRIYCSGPMNQHEIFQSFVPPALKELANKFDLLQKFLPVEAIERIKNGDRGYWKMLIRITSLVVVAKSRRSPLSCSQWSDQKFLLTRKAQQSTAIPGNSADVDDIMRQRHYPNKDPATFTPWTLDEFVNFWALLRKTIEKGRAGYDVHASIADNITECEEGVDMEVRFYGYAEALSHMWCILYVLSNKKAAHVPMQWMGPGQGTLVRMSGQPKCGGSLGRWIEISPGIQGSWGLQDLSEMENVGEG